MIGAEGIKREKEKKKGGGGGGLYQERGEKNRGGKKERWREGGGGRTQERGEGEKKRGRGGEEVTEGSNVILKQCREGQMLVSNFKVYLMVMIQSALSRHTPQCWISPLLHTVHNMIRLGFTF